MSKLTLSDIEKILNTLENNDLLNLVKDLYNQSDDNKMLIESKFSKNIKSFYDFRTT